MIDAGLSVKSAELRIWLLGTFRMAVGTRVIDDAAWRLQKPKSLIKLLALAPGHRLHREQITDMLWRDLLPQAAANNFHQALHTARRILEPTRSAASFPSFYLSLQHDFLVLHSPDILWIDAEVFEADAIEVLRKQKLDGCRAALELYTGDLLPEDRYETWTFARRETLRDKYLALLTEYARLLESNGEYLLAIETLERVVTSDPAHEEAQVGLMRLFAQTGQRYQALQQYRRLSEALQQAFDAEPSESSEHLYRNILLRRYPARPSPSNVFVAPETKQSRTNQLILPSSG